MNPIRYWRDRHARAAAHFWARSNGREVLPTNCHCRGCTDGMLAWAQRWVRG